MTTDLHWPDIALRLLLTVCAGAALGFERSKTGHPAGLRTTLLVTLAASISMIQMNLLIPTNGKPPNSYAVMDLMRLPLGILTGVGFIGVGAIVRKGEMVLGVTTAATMWFATIVGLCLGGGQVILGSTATILGLAVLWGFKFWERQLETQQRGQLTLSINQGSFAAETLSQMLISERMRVKAISVTYQEEEPRDKFCFEVRWHKRGPSHIPEVIERLRRLPGVLSCEWSSSGPT